MNRYIYLSIQRNGASGFMYYESRKVLTNTEIKRILASHYTKYRGGTLEENLKRELIWTVVGRPDFDGAIMYILHGSPPKGYAIYTSNRLWLFNPSGRRFANWDNVEVRI